MKKKESATANLTFIALMSAINIIFAILMLFLPALSMLIYLFLPLATTLTIIFCKRQYLIIYFIASIGISFIINLNGLEYIIFTLIPSLITGSIFGLCIEKKVNIGITVLISSFFQFLISLLTIPLINVIYTNNQNIIAIFASFLGENKTHLTYKLFLPLTYAVALAQNIISFLIISSQVSKFNIQLNEQNPHYIAYSYLNLALILLDVLAIFFFDDLMYLFLAFSLVLSLITLTSMPIRKNKLFMILSLITLLIVFVGFIIFAQFNYTLYTPLLLLLLTLYLSLFDIFYSLFQKNKLHAKIK